MKLKMTIEQCNNGWVLIYTGHDVLDKQMVCNDWKLVEKIMNDYFGWYDTQGNWTKIPK